LVDGAAVEAAGGDPDALTDLDVLEDGRPVEVGDALLLTGWGGVLLVVFCPC
jgi:hypothetical protein